MQKVQYAKFKKKCIDMHTVHNIEHSAYKSQSGIVIPFIRTSCTKH